MTVITKKTLLIALPLMLSACAYPVQPYAPNAHYGVNVQPARPYYPSHHYQQPPVYYVKPAPNEHHHHDKHHHHYNEHYDNGKHNGQYKNNKHKD